MLGEDVENWVYIGGVWDEEQPYRECPNCGEYKFRTLRKDVCGFMGLRKKGTVFMERCVNCMYKGDTRAEK